MRVMKLASERVDSANQKKNEKKNDRLRAQ